MSIMVPHNAAVLRFERLWWAAVDHDFTPHGVCDDETYDRLPAVPEQLFTGDFRWLSAEAAGPDAYYMQPNPVPPAALQLLNRRLSRCGVLLPASFVTFVSSSLLQGRIPSSTCNGWEMSDPAPSPVEKYGFLLRFMHDQQGCWFFYLYLAEDGSCPVLGSEELFTPEVDEDRTFTARDFMESARWLAPNFEEFVYRYWVENVIWHQTIYKQRPVGVLPALAQEYASLLKVPGRPPLNSWPVPLSPWGDHPDQLTLW
jgi:hypothetical protein